MPAYTVEQWEFIVGQLAAYVSPKTIVAEFSLRWPTTACEPADVSQFQRDKLPADWQAFFDRERATFLDPPTKDRAVRVAELHRMFIAARDRGAVDLAAKLLAQIESSAGASGEGSGGSGPAGAGPITSITRTIIDPKPIADEAPT